MRRFLAGPGQALSAESTVLADLIYGWGNSGWSASRDYLASSIQHAGAARGAVVECGSGLSTLLAGANAARNGVRYVALEHNPAWGDRVNDYLNRFNIEGVTVSVAPLRSYGDYSWYNPGPDDLPETIGLVICDGPPASTLGGRFGFLPCLQDRFVKGTSILMDDVERPAERELVNQIGHHFDVDICELGTQRSFASLLIKGPLPV